MSDPNDVFQDVANDIKAINDQFKVARELIDGMKEAGEDVTQMESEYRDLVVRKGKWERMLKNRGISL